MSRITHEQLAGSGNWTAPAGVTKVTVFLLGAGGGGGGGCGGSGGDGSTAGGGSNVADSRIGARPGLPGNSIVVQDVVVTPGTSYPYVVGQGGAGGTPGAGGASGGASGASGSAGIAGGDTTMFSFRAKGGIAGSGHPRPPIGAGWNGGATGTPGHSGSVAPSGVVRTDIPNMLLGSALLQMTDVTQNSYNTSASCGLGNGAGGGGSLADNSDYIMAFSSGSIALPTFVAAGAGGATGVAGSDGTDAPDGPYMGCGGFAGPTGGGGGLNAAGGAGGMGGAGANGTITLEYWS